MTRLTLLCYCPPIKRVDPGLKFMKSLKFVTGLIGLLSIGAPATAQLSSESDQFVEAVAKRNGDKATDLLQVRPRIVDSRDAKGDTGLLIAINRSDREWTGFLLNKGADPNLAGNTSSRPSKAKQIGGADHLPPRLAFTRSFLPLGLDGLMPRLHFGPGPAMD